tara:strand:- start:809 stop:1639 length:831 start_codon:yes stop_codon:yes gene_type:complete
MSILDQNSINELKENGFIKITNFLNEDEFKSIKKICIKYCKQKHEDNYFSRNTMSFLSKLVQFKYSRFLSDLKIFRIVNRKKLKDFSKAYFEKNVELSNIDGYISKMANRAILPWHTDRAYSDKNGDKKIEKFLHPDDCNLKIFVYLTDVSPGNGCMSYIPKTHKIGFLIRKGIYTKKLRYSPYWSLKQFRSFLEIKENFEYINDNLKEKNLIQNFLEISKNLDDTKLSNFDYEAKQGDAVIFNEGGIHRGSTPTKNDRLVLRYFLKPKESSYTRL